MIKELKVKELYNKCSKSIFSFKNTQEVKKTNQIILQGRALSAIDTALGIEEEGFNLFVMGEKGRGKHSLIKKILETKSKNSKNIYDWCYVNNFNDDNKPIIIKLKAGLAKSFKKSMLNLVENLKIKITQVLKSKKYLNQKNP